MVAFREQQTEQQDPPALFGRTGRDIGVKAGSEVPPPHLICRSQQPRPPPQDTLRDTLSSHVPPALTQRP